MVESETKTEQYAGVVKIRDLRTIVKSCGETPVLMNVHILHRCKDEEFKFIGMEIVCSILL